MKKVSRHKIRSMMDLHAEKKKLETLNFPGDRTRNAEPITPETVNTLNAVEPIPPETPKPSEATPRSNYSDLSPDGFWGDMSNAPFAELFKQAEERLAKGSPIKDPDDLGASLRLEQQRPEYYDQPKKRTPKEVMSALHSTFVEWEAHAASQTAVGAEKPLTSRLSEQELTMLSARYLDSARRCRKLKPLPDVDNELLHLKRVVAMHSSVPELSMHTQVDMGNLCTRIAHLYYKSKTDYDNSVEYHGKCMVHRMRTQGPSSLEVAAAHNNMAIVLNIIAKKDKSFDPKRSHLWMSKCNEALEHFSAALKIRVKKLGLTDPLVCNVLHGMGSCYTVLEAYPKAIQCYDRCVRARIQSLGLAHLATKQAHGQLANLLMLRGEAILKANLSRHKTAALEALKHPTDPKPPQPASSTTASSKSSAITDDTAPSGEVREEASIPLKFQTTLEAALDHFHRVYFIRTECLGENDMRTMAAKVAVEDTVKAIVDRNEATKVRKVRLDKAKERNALKERYKSPPHKAKAKASPKPNSKMLTTAGTKKDEGKTPENAKEVGFVEDPGSKAVEEKNMAERVREMQAQLAAMREKSPEEGTP